MKKPIGSQFSFSNLDGARASISSEDRLSISFERQEAVEDGVEEEIEEEKEEEEEEEKNEKVVQLWSPEKLRRDYITNDLSATCGPSGKVTGSEGHEFNNALEKVEAATEVNAVSTPERCYRPVERARERRRLRLEESQRSSVLRAWEQERVYLRCVQCNHVFTDSDWSQFKSEGWDVEVIKLCNPCIDSMIEHE